MNNDCTLNIKNFTPLQKTLFLPLWGRVREPEIIVDQKAAQIVKKFNTKLDFLDAKLPMRSRLIWAVRAGKFDETIRRFIQKNPDANIVSLGCGLETTFYRVDNGKIDWYDLDLLEVIEFKKGLMGSHGRIHYIDTSVFDSPWWDQIDDDRPLLIIAVGVFMFYDRKDIVALIEKIFAHKRCTLIFDGYSKVGRIYANSYMRKAGLGSSLVKMIVSRQELERISSVKKVRVIHLFGNIKNKIDRGGRTKRFMIINDAIRACALYRLSNE